MWWAGLGFATGRSASLGCCPARRTRSSKRGRREACAPESRGTRVSAEVLTPLEARFDARPGQLVDGQPLTARRPERTDGPLRDLEGVAPDPAPRLELGRGVGQAGDAIDEDRYVALDVIGEEKPGRIRGQLDHCDSRPHRVDREYDAAAKDVAEPGHIRGTVAARPVDVVEPFEPHQPGLTGDGRSARSSASSSISRPSCHVPSGKRWDLRSQPTGRKPTFS